MSDFLNNINVKDYFNKVKNVVMQYGEWEAKVREATNNDPWGASSTMMQELAQATNFHDKFQEIINTIVKRLDTKEQQWRNIYKALSLLEYLIKNGADTVSQYANKHMTYELKSLDGYQFVDTKGKDQGINVRQRAKEVLALIGDADRLKFERDKAMANKNKYRGVASDAAQRLGYGGTSFNSNAYDMNDYQSSSNPASPQEQPQQFTNVATKPSQPQVVPKPAPTNQFTTDLLSLDEPVPQPTGFSAQNNNGGFANFESASGFSNPPQNTSFFSQPNNAQSGQFANFQSGNNNFFGNSGNVNGFIAPPPQKQPDPFGGLNNASTGFANFPPPNGLPNGFSGANSNNGFQTYVATNQAGTTGNLNQGFATFDKPGMSQANDEFADFEGIPTQSNNNKNTFNSVLNSNLVSLNSIGKYEKPKEESKPSLTTLANFKQSQVPGTQSPFAQSPWGQQ